MPDDFIRPLEVAITSSLKDIQETMAHIEDSLKATNAAIISSYEASQKSINDKTKKAADAVIKANEASAKKINDDTADTHEEIRNKDKETADKINENQKSTAETVGSILSSSLASAATQAAGQITNQFRSMLQEYTREQQKLSFNLIGSGMTYDTVKTALASMGANAFIKQQKVYENLTNLVSSGITMNAAQRAYLQTAAEQVGLQFRANDESLNRLIQLQQADLSEARLAQMAGLKEFLEQNYKNSQYIYNGFNQVSNALIQMQSLMTAQVAMSTEKTIQTYLGAFTSAGGSGADTIAQAIGKIGAGDFNLDSGMQNLLVMAASRAGLSYADILNRGLDSGSSERLMQEMFKYIASMGGNNSNVAMNAMANAFGVSVSDIRAAQQMNVGNISTDYSTDISKFFAQIEESTNRSTQLATWWENALSNQALTTPLGLVGFDIANSLSQIIGGGLKSLSQAQSIWGSVSGANKGEAILGTVVENLPALGILGSIGMDIGKNFFSLDTLKGLSSQEGLNGFISKFLEAAGFGQGAVLRDYNALGGIDNSSYFTTQGNFSGVTGGTSQSGVITNDEDQKPGTTVEFAFEEGEKEGYDFQDLYHLLADDYPTTTFMTEANIAHANNEVLLGDSKTTQYLVDMLTITAVSTENILMILENSLGGANRTLIDMSALNLVNMWGDWSGTTGGGGE